jgi:LmbE family N-acetylglucosaminyl deacetylase
MTPMRTLRLMAVLAHPDDESLGIGGTLAKYASEGVEVFLLSATRGDGGRYRTFRPGDPQHPGADALGAIRERELCAAASVLGVKDVAFLEYRDQQLDRAKPSEVIAEIVRHLRRVQPDVIITFGPDGAYGHPDHIAISQFATAAIVAAAEPAISKLYYIAWRESTWAAYQHAFKKLTSTVAVWKAIACHESQMSAYEQLKNLPPEDHMAIWGKQSFYRAFSTVNGGRRPETDLFEGIRNED